MLAKEILTAARYTLSDIGKDRWTDERLLSLLTDGILDLARTTTLFIEETFYVIQNNVVNIDLSSRATKIIMAEYMDEPLPLLPWDEMIKKDPKWQLEVGEKAKALVYDKQAAAILKLYPVVQNAQTDNIEYEGGPYGIITGISYSDIAPILVDDYGDISDIPPLALIKIYYVRRHDKLTDINQELNIDEMLKQPLTHYVAGMALRDNQDTQNRTMGNEELSFFEAMKAEYAIEKSKLFVRAPRTVPYKPLG